MGRLFTALLCLSVGLPAQLAGARADRPGPSPAAAAGHNPPSLRQVGAWIKQLLSDDADGRALAERKLLESADAAVVLLRAAAEKAPREKQALLRDVLVRVEQQVERDWEERVRRLPELWPGGTYKDTTRNMVVRMKHERVQHDGREALRLTEEWSAVVKGADNGAERPLPTRTFLCRPDKYLTPIRITIVTKDGEPGLDLTFEGRRAAGTMRGENVERDLPERFVPGGLMSRRIAMMPFAAGWREEVQVVRLSRLDVRKIEIVCEGAIDRVVNGRRQRSWTFLTRDLASEDDKELYLFSEDRKLQKIVSGPTPMGEFVPVK